MLDKIMISETFSSIATLLSLLGDAAVLILTIYTLHITAFSRKLMLVKQSVHYSTFYGNSISFTFMNKSLHAIPVENVFIMKEDEGVIRFLQVVDFEDPVAIDSWGIRRIDMPPYTKIIDYSKNDSEISFDPDDFMENSIIGVKAGKGISWVRTTMKSVGISSRKILKKMKKAYHDHNYIMVDVYRHKEDGRVISEVVDCKILLRMQDINGNIVLKKLFGITGFDDGKSVLLDGDIFGYNVIRCPGKSAKEIKKTIHKEFGIAKEDIHVEMIKLFAK